MDNNMQSPHISAPEENIDLRALLEKYLKKWYWFVISVTVCVGIALAYLVRAIPQYNVQTTLLLRDDKASNPMSQFAMLEGLGDLGGSKIVDDEIQVLTTKTIASDLIHSLGLSTEYYAKRFPMKYRELYPLSPVRLDLPRSLTDTLTKTLRFDIRPRKGGYEVKFEGGESKAKYRLASLDEPFTTLWGEMCFTQVDSLKKGTRYRVVCTPHRVLVERYSKDISVGLVNKKSNAIRASMTTGTPKKAVAVLNELVRLYNQDVVNDKNLIGQSTARFVDEQIASLERELSQIEVEIELYKRANNLTDISAEAKFFLESMGEYDKQLAEIQTQINLTAYIDQYLRREENRFGLVPANLGVTDPSLVELIKQYNEALLERLQLLRTTNEQNPVIAQAEKTLDVMREAILTSIQSISDGLDIAKADLVAKGAQFNTRIQDVPRQEREYIEKMRRQEVSQTLYVYLLQKKKENELSMATTLPPAKVLDKAYASLEPVSPRKMVTLAVALLLGACIPLALIYLLDLLNNTVQDKKEYQRLVRAPYLGSIPTNKSGNNVVVTEGTVTPVVEMFRQLRTNLQFMVAGKQCPVILVTSSVSGEGKSFISVNLALSFALMKKRVALIGLDIRNPMLGDYMHLPKARTGATVYLSDPSVQASDIMTEVPGNPYLCVIQGGPVPPNPTELLMSQRLDDLIAGLKQSFDYIIIDSAPVGVVSDTFQINRVVDNTVYVSRQHYTTREVTGLINELYESHKLNNMAVMLNGTDEVAVYYGYNHKRYMKAK